MLDKCRHLIFGSSCCIAKSIYLRYHASMHVITIDPKTVFQALADPIRIRMVRLLFVSAEEACLCELVDSLLEEEYKLSRHMKHLKTAGIVSVRRAGRWVYHRLSDEPAYLQELFGVLNSLPDEKSVFTNDLDRFHQRMKLRRAGRCQLGIQAKHLSNS
ncbi:MAG: ArsR/SmtB family transcription factor [Oligoflexus sp.]